MKKRSATGKRIAERILNTAEKVIDTDGETYLDIFNSGIIIDLKKIGKKVLNTAKESLEHKKNTKKGEDIT